MTALVLAGCGSGDRETAALDGAECRPDRPERIAVAPLPVENLLVSAPRTTMDTDGDGNDDVVAVEAGAVSITRGDGVLHLAEPGHDVALHAWGDLDGDGRDDLALAHTTLPSGPTAVQLVRGSTPAGIHAPSAAGVRVDDQLHYPWLQDLDSRPGAEVVVSVSGVSRSYTDVYSGAALLAVGAGGDGRGAAPVFRLEGLTRGIAPLAVGIQPETLLLSPGPRAAVRFASRPGALLESPLGPAARVEDVLVFDEDGVRKVGLQIDDRVAVWPAPSACGR
jgi:hypothetical protein